MRLSVSKLFPLVFLLISCSALPVVEIDSSQNENPFSEWQDRMLEKIQLLAREGGLPTLEWKGITKYDKEVCYEDECLESALEIMTATNFSVNPCDPDQWLDYVCMRRVNGPDNINQVERLMKIVDAQTRELLDEKDNPLAKDFLLNEAQTFYYQCKNKALNDDQDVKDILEYTKEKYGGWPIFTNHNPGNDFDWLSMVADMNKIERYNYKPLLLHVTTSMSGIEVGVGRTFFAITNEDYFKMFLRLQKSSGLRKPARIDQIQGMHEFVNKASYAGLNKGLQREMTIKQLQNSTELYFKLLNTTNYHVDWLKFFKRIFEGSDLEISKNTTVTLVLQQVLGIVGVANEAYAKNKTLDMSNALHFKLISTLLLESTTLLDDLNSCKCDEESGSRDQICLTRTTEIFGYSLGKSYLKVHYNDSKTTPAIEKLMANIQKGYVDVINEKDWMEQKTKDLVKDKIKHIKTFYTQPDWTRDPKKLRKFYRGLKASTDKNSSYPLNYLNVMSWVVQAKASHSKKLMDITEINDLKAFHIYDIEWSRYLGTVQAMFHERVNEARIEGGILQSPLFAVERPGFMNYGGVGMLLAHEIGHSFDQTGRLYNNDGEKREFWDPISVERYNHWVKSISEDYGNYTHQTSDTDKERINPLKTLDEDIADILGIYMSYHSYQEYLKELEGEGKKEKILPGLKSFPPQKLFYMKYGNMWCDKKDVQDHYNDLLSDHSAGNIRATLPLKRSKEFAQTFGCPMPERKT